MKVICVAGGSGGHIIPALAVADELQKQKHDVFFVCAQNALDLEIITNYASNSLSTGSLRITKKNNNEVISNKQQNQKFQWQAIQWGKLRRYFSLKNFTDPIFLIIGFFQSLKVISREQPDVVFSKGGFVAVPMCLAAWVLRVPVVTHESDMVSGLANKLCNCFAIKKLSAFELKGYKQVGLPIRSFDSKQTTNNKQRTVEGDQKLPAVAISSEQNEEGRSEYEVRRSAEIRNQKSLQRNQLPLLQFKNPSLPLLVGVFGSQGAESINQVFWKICNQVAQYSHVIWVVGPTNTAPDNLPENIRTVAYLHNDYFAMMQAADLVVCRSGSNLWEMAALKKACLTIPLPTAANNHQHHNAQYFLQRNSVALLAQKDITPQVLEKAIRGLVDNPKQRNRLSDNLSQLAQPHATEKIAREIIAVAEQKI